MGTGGMTLAEGVNLKNESIALTESCTTSVSRDYCAGVVVGMPMAGSYSVTVANTTDNSERLRIIHSAEDASGALATTTWINVTTGHTVADVIALPGTVVLSYDISAPADLVSSTSVKVYVTTDGNNGTDNPDGAIDVNITGNSKSGVFDLTPNMADTAGILSEDVSADQLIGTSAQSSLISVAFAIGHEAGSDMSATADYAIYADFCNFDQDNGSLVHNCMYRLEAVETGANTGIFEGTVEYINMTNSTTGGLHQW